MSVNFIWRPALGWLLAGFVTTAGWAQEPVYLSVHTTTRNDSLVAGVLGRLHFTIDSIGSTPLTSVTWPLEFRFTNGNLIGVIMETGTPPNLGVVPWPVKPSTVLFTYSQMGSDPDTVAMHLARSGNPYWTAPGEMWRVTFVPLDSGRIIVDTATVNGQTLTVRGEGGQALPVVWKPDTIVVAPYCPTGDLNEDGIINDIDLVILIRYVQLGGPAPPACLAHADADGNGIITSADIIYQIHYTYHGDRSLSNTCRLIDEGIWTCP